MLTPRRLIATVLVVLTVLYTGLGITGYFLFARPHGDPLAKADAIVVLGGDMDGRLEYGLSLARMGYADTVVLSNSYRPGNQRFARACQSGTAQITVVCFRPDPFTTRGEAMFTQRLAQERGWHHVIVTSTLASGQGSTATPVRRFGQSCCAWLLRGEH